jgi:hypothetical protein
MIDPYRSPESGGYEPIDEAADLVIVSHENDTYHSHLGQIRPPFEVIRALELGPGGTTFRGVRVGAIPVFETPEKKPGDEVTIVTLEADGLFVVHLGDLGHDLTDAEIRPLRGADALLVPVGGPPTIDLALVPELITRMGPAVVVPMHYLVPGKINLKIQTVEEFLRVIDANPRSRGEGDVFLATDHRFEIERAMASTLELRPGDAHTTTRLVVLEPAR